MRFPKFSSSKLEKIWKTHSEVFSKAKKFKRRIPKYLFQGKKEDWRVIKEIWGGKRNF
jgi:hypothetical protein